jgi:hypothetical protein
VGGGREAVDDLTHQGAEAVAGSSTFQARPRKEDAQPDHFALNDICAPKARVTCAPVVHCLRHARRVWWMDRMRVGRREENFDRMLILRVGCSRLTAKETREVRSASLPSC